MSFSLPTSCDICKDCFSVDKLPLFLPCYHAFCKVCICKLELKQERQCPQCKMKWTDNLVEPGFAAIVKMLPTKDECEQEEDDETEQAEVPCDEHEKKELTEKTPEAVLCIDHQEQVMFYCIDCQEQLCVECVTLTHKNHDFCTTKKSGEKVKQAIRTSLNEALEKFEKEDKAVDVVLDMTTENKAHLQNFEREVTRVKNCHKNFQKKLLSQKQEIQDRYPPFAQVEEKLSKAPEFLSPPVIEELQRSVKYKEEEPLKATVAESCIDTIAKIYMVN